MVRAPVPRAEAEREGAKDLASGLYLVATPIGNLRDITLRALDVLDGADLVLAEDTRVAGRLLAAHRLTARLQRYDEHAAARARPTILAALGAGARVALTSDAGTPLISDPGYRLVVEAVAQGTSVFPIPGPCAALAALTVAALPTDRFLFAGFPPTKRAARRTFLEDLVAVRASLIFYESGSRLAESLTDMALVFGPRQAAVARELTKLYETVVRGPLNALATDPRLAAPKGELVVVVGPGEMRRASLEEADAALAATLSRLGPAAAASEVARSLGLNRREVYARALALKAR
ncbi:MAG: 16S rRNA (cytidine(1402)-2'-O)-methyltransferase [Caulobacteraceae bacterium]